MWHANPVPIGDRPLNGPQPDRCHTRPNVLARTCPRDSFPVRECPAGEQQNIGRNSPGIIEEWACSSKQRNPGAESADPYSDVDTSVGVGVNVAIGVLVGVGTGVSVGVGDGIGMCVGVGVTSTSHQTFTLAPAVFS